MNDHSSSFIHHHFTTTSCFNNSSRIPESQNSRIPIFQFSDLRIKAGVFCSFHTNNSSQHYLLVHPFFSCELVVVVSVAPWYLLSAQGLLLSSDFRRQVEVACVGGERHTFCRRAFSSLFLAVCVFALLMFVLHHVTRGILCSILARVVGRAIS